MTRAAATALRPAFAAFLIAAASCALSVAYAFRIAPGNAPDERAHAQYVVSLRETGRLPLKDWPAHPYSYEAKQPPLYYALGAALTLPFSAAAPLIQVRALRLLSAALNLGALLLIYLLARRLYPDARGALGPLAAAAFLPMFVFLGACVSNDAAAELAGAGLLLAAIELPRLASARRGALVGVLAGLALLVKTTTLPAAAGAFAALIAAERQEKRNPLKQAVIAALAILAIAGWFYGRNIILYQDPSGLGLATSQGGFDADRYAWSQLGLWWELYFESFWGRFGAMTQPMPREAYALLAAASALACCGWARSYKALLERPGRRLLWGVFGGAVALNFLFGFFLSYQPQARYCFPALGAWAVLFWDGLSAALGLMAPGARGATAGLGVLTFLMIEASAWLSL